MTEKITSPLKHALCEFKKKKVKITKGTVNPFFKSKYADLTEILSSIEEDLSSLGVIITSKSVCENGSWQLVTTVEHIDSDEVMQSSFPIFGSKPQELGSSITYARRYNIQSLINLTAEDDDGNSSNEAKPAAPKVDPKKAANNYFEKAKAELDALKTPAELTAWEQANKEYVDRLVKYDDLAQDYSKYYSETFARVNS